MFTGVKHQPHQVSLPDYLLPNLALWDQGGAQARRTGGRPAAPLTAAARLLH
jgi:hypothetical protein